MCVEISPKTYFELHLQESTLIEIASHPNVNYIWFNRLDTHSLPLLGYFGSHPNLDGTPIVQSQW